MANVLLVEAEPRARSATAAVLERAGHTVLAAADADAALALLGGGGVDVVVTAVSLPGRSGLELLTAVRQAALHLPVILLAGTPDLQTATAALRGRAFDYLAKPVAAETLVRAVAEAVQEKAHEDESEQLASESRQSRYSLTERKRAEEALRREHELLSRIIETSPVGITVVDRDGQITFANARAEGILGLTRAGITQRTYNAAAWRTTDYTGRPFPAEDMPFQRVRRTGQVVYYIRHAIEGPAGRRVLLSVSAAPLTAVDGTFDGMVAAIQDVTEHVRAEEALREREDLLNAVGEMALVGGWELDPATRRVRWTRETYRIHELPETAEPDLQARVDFFDPRDRPILQTALERAMQAGDPFDLELRLVTATGKRLWTRATARTEMAAGRPVKIRGTFQDITERKRAEEALGQYAAELRQFSRRLLDVREEERRSLAATLHHEVGSAAVGLKARLQAAEAALRQQRPGEAQEILAATAEMLGQWLTRLKDLAFELRPPDLDILGLPAALRAYFTRLTGHTPIRVDFSCRGYAEQVAGELATVLFRVAQQSLTNTLCHASAKRVRVTLSTSRRGVRLSVTDDGVGFDPGQALAPGTPHMGLRAMREMVAGRGGEFRLESAPGKGTRIKVVIPVPGEQ